MVSIHPLTNFGYPPLLIHDVRPLAVLCAFPIVHPHAAPRTRDDCRDRPSHHHLVPAFLQLSEVGGDEHNLRAITQRSTARLVA
jgi:hypothetical protein